MVMMGETAIIRPKDTMFYTNFIPYTVIVVKR